MSKKITVEIAMLVRRTKTVVVEVPDDFSSWPEDLQNDLCKDIYDDDDGQDGWEPDDEWGCEEGTHAVIGEESPEFQIAGNTEYKATVEDGEIILDKA